MPLNDKQKQYLKQLLVEMSVALDNAVKALEESKIEKMEFNLVLVASNVSNTLHVLEKTSGL